MCTTTFAALLGLAVGCGLNPSADLPGPVDLLAPLDPRAATRWHPPPSPVAGLKRYAPVSARDDWGSAASPARPPGMSMPGMSMPGMSMPGMSMPGTGK